MAPDHPSQPPGPETFNGKGMFITVQVADATAEFARLIRDALRSVDPSGTWVDVVQQIAPAPGFWDKYLT
jgi:hypothetical protein